MNDKCFSHRFISLPEQHTDFLSKINLIDCSWSMFSDLYLTLMNLILLLSFIWLDYSPILLDSSPNSENWVNIEHEKSFTSQ